MPTVFTGIIEHVGRVHVVRRLTRGAGLTITVGPLAVDLALGDSVAVDGICLTATTITGEQVEFDVSAESLRRSTIASWRAGRMVNLERALRVGDRLGGHLVMGHVDGVGRLLSRKREGEAENFTFLLPGDGSVRVVEKGSVAVDGISLTSWRCRGGQFTVAVVPHSLGHSTLGGMRPGRRVQLEQDPIGRWVEASMQGTRR